MTHEHPLDLALTAAALARRLPFVGLIGSHTKRARFEKRFREIGIPEERIRALVCPIGLPGIARQGARHHRGVASRRNSSQVRENAASSLAPPSPSAAA